MQQLGSAGYVEIPVRLAAAQAFAATSRGKEARAQLDAAAQEIHRRAQKIPDSDAAHLYMTLIPEHAEVFSLLEAAGWIA